MHRVSPDGGALATRLSPSAYDRLLSELAEELQALQQAGLLRRLTTVEAVDGIRLRLQGREVVNWCSNDYLGLSTHPRLISAAADAAAADGVGARASRLLAGTTRWHTHLEEALAAWFHAEAAVVFSSGYLANLGALGALLSRQDAVFVDRLAHASLLDAARATRAAFRIFRHQDPEHLEALLSRAARSRRRVIVTEGVFSMDGDSPPLAELLDVAERHDAVVYLDDAHGAFVLGETGRGAPEAAGIPHDRFLYMGTLGKALGCQGGFLVGPRALMELLHNRARTFLYETALAVPVAAAATEALQLAELPQLREVLRQRVRRLQERLSAIVSLPHGASHIVPILLGDARRAMELSRRLWEQGIWAPAIRPPTVPKGTARLRLSVTALHTDDHIDHLIEALRECGIGNSEFGM
jgi:8-amino-7-oxononanoate synthase